MLLKQKTTSLMFNEVSKTVRGRIFLVPNVMRFLSKKMHSSLTSKKKKIQKIENLERKENMKSSSASEAPIVEETTIKTDKLGINKSLSWFSKMIVIPIGLYYIYKCFATPLSSREHSNYLVSFGQFLGGYSLIYTGALVGLSVSHYQRDKFLNKNLLNKKTFFCFSLFMLVNYQMFELDKLSYYHSVGIYIGLPLLATGYYIFAKELGIPGSFQRHVLISVTLFILAYSLMSFLQVLGNNHIKTVETKFNTFSRKSFQVKEVEDNRKIADSL